MGWWFILFPLFFLFGVTPATTTTKNVLSLIIGDESHSVDSEMRVEENWGKLDRAFLPSSWSALLDRLIIFSL